MSQFCHLNSNVGHRHLISVSRMSCGSGKGLTSRIETWLLLEQEYIKMVKVYLKTEKSQYEFIIIQYFSQRSTEYTWIPTTFHGHSNNLSRASNRTKLYLWVFHNTTWYDHHISDDMSSYLYITWKNNLFNLYSMYSIWCLGHFH